MDRRKIVTRSLSGLFAGLLTAACGAASAAEAPTPPTFDAVLSRLGYTDEDKLALLDGRIVTADLKRTREDQLIAAVAVVVNAPLATLAENTRKGLNIERDEDVAAFGRLSDQSGIEQFAAARYSAADRQEVERLIGATPDGTFNLSEAELATLNSALEGVDPDDGAAADKVSQAYQAVLFGRYRSYLARGLDGITDYEAGSRLTPAGELRSVYAQARPFLDEFFPAFSAALGGFPANQAPEVSSTFYWMARNVEGRPAFILAHQMVQSSADFVLLSQRHYFVGHTYESLQAVALALPHENGSAVFYVNSAYTDKITGFFSGVAQSVGQSRTKEDLTEYFENARKRLPE